MFIDSILCMCVYIYIYIYKERLTDQERAQFDSALALDFRVDVVDKALQVELKHIYIYIERERVYH